MKWITLIPTSRNDGSPVSQAEQNEILKRIIMKFGGASVERQIDGYWHDPTDNQTYQDQNLRVTVACDSELLSDAEKMVRDIGKQLEQKAMYFEVQHFDGVRILRTDQ